MSVLFISSGHQKYQSSIRPSEPRIILLAESGDLWTITMLLDLEMDK